MTSQTAGSGERDQRGRPGSPSAYAFGRLFGDSNVYDLRDQGIDKILKNKDLVKALKGAV